MTERDRSFWPVSNEKPEDAMFSIVLDSEACLFRGGSVIQGAVFIHFKDTHELVSFQQLNICMKENVSLPELENRKKNVITHIIIEEILLNTNKDTYTHSIDALNASKEFRVPFKIQLPDDLPSSFNSSQLTICYELKAELLELQLCGEICDLSTTLSIEIVERHSTKSKSLNHFFNDDQEPSSQVQEAINGELVTFYASLKKNCFHADEGAVVDVYLDQHSCLDAEIQFELIQILQIQGEEQKHRIIVSFKEIFQPASSGIVLTKQEIMLQNSLLNTQPTVSNSPYIVVNYLLSLVAFVNDVSLELSIPVIIERKESVRMMYQPALSPTRIPLLPITVTANELKSDGLQSYIPMKQCYENKRLIVKKGNTAGMKTLLTIISESYKAYTKDDKIKGFVYFSINNSVKDVQFEKLLILLVGVLRYKCDDGAKKNGEMFLYERKVLRGSPNNNSSFVNLPKPSGTIVVEFEFDLNKIGKILPPTFDSNDVNISYELKADVFNLVVDGEKSSLYTTMPIIVKESKLCTKVDQTGSFGSVCTKDFFISASLDKPVYQHKDDIVVNINLENKSKKQLTLCVQLNQVTESFHPKNKYNEVPMSKSTVLLVLPKSKLVSTEKISLKDLIFHRQPTLVSCSEFSVTYKITISSPSHPYHKLAIPVLVIRKSGHTVKELSREGYPLLPVTLEFYSQKDGNLPNYLEYYNNRSLVKILRSESCHERWKNWKLK